MKYVFVLLFFISCSAIDISEQEPLRGMSVGEAWAWIDENIAYKADFIDDFQLPNTTYALRTGDCEDFCILLMSVMNAQGPAPELVCISHGKSIHYIIQWANEYYEPQCFQKFYSKNEVQENFLWSFSYKTSLSMAY